MLAKSARSDVPLPESDVLLCGLTSLFHDDTKAQYELLHRENNKKTSTAPSEVVTLLRSNNVESRYFCKYGISNEPGDSKHRQGVSYESRVYGEILQEQRCGTPSYFGTWCYGDGYKCLVTEFFDDALQVGDVPSVQGAIPAARWLGSLQRLYDLGVISTPSFLKQSDADYLKSWSRRTLEFSQASSLEMPWLDSICRSYEDLVDDLRHVEPTFVHGEFYPDNVLLHKGLVRPVDWESACMGIGEIDLASLTMDWSADSVEHCRQAYVESRWVTEEPTQHLACFQLCRLYWLFRWLGESITWVPKMNKFYEDLHRLGMELNLLS